METADSTDLIGELNLAVLSLGTTALLIALLLPLFATIGYLLGSHQRRRAHRHGVEPHPATGEATLGANLALLGLLLAFSFGNAISTFQKRSDALLTEANALGTAFARANYALEDRQDDLKMALLEYARSRVIPEGGFAGEREKLADFLDRTTEAQSRLIPVTLQATADPLPDPLKTFIAGSMNSVIDAHLIRLQAFSAPFQEYTSWMTLVVACIALFLLGNRSGFSGRSLTWRTFIFSAVLWVVMYTILDLQRSESGFIVTERYPLALTIQDMEKDLAANS